MCQSMCSVCVFACVLLFTSINNKHKKIHKYERSHQGAKMKK